MSKRSYTETEKLGSAPANRAETGQFQPGQSGNPSGRPKKDRELTAALQETVDKEKLAEKLWAMALEGEMAAIKYIYDRIEGSPTQRHEADLEEVRVEARRLAAELGLDEDIVLSEAEDIIRSAR